MTTREWDAIRARHDDFGKSVKVWHCFGDVPDDKHYPCGEAHAIGHGATSVLADVTCIDCCKAVIEQQTATLRRIEKIAGGDE